MNITCIYMLISDERRKEEISKQGHTNNTKVKQHNTPRQTIFQRKKSCLGWDSNPRHSICIIIAIHNYICTHKIIYLLMLHIHAKHSPETESNGGELGGNRGRKKVNEVAIVQ